MTPGSGLPPPAWWPALVDVGLDTLSPPELAHAVRELTAEPPRFLHVLRAAADWPRHGLLGRRRADEAALARLDALLPLPRAVVAPDDPVALAMAAVAFPALLVLDPFWAAREVLYDAWHARRGLGTHQAAGLLAMAGPAVRLGPLLATAHVGVVPDTAPRRWEPYPLPLRAPATASGRQRAAVAVHRAARLLWWADRLQAAAVAADAEVAPMLRALASFGADLRGRPADRLVRSMQPPSVDRAAALRAAALARRSSNPGAPGRRPHDGPRPLRRVAGEPTRAWRSGTGASVLPDVALLVLRADRGRPLPAGPPGEPTHLRRPARYLVPAPGPGTIA